MTRYARNALLPALAAGLMLLSACAQQAPEAAEPVAQTAAPTQMSTPPAPAATQESIRLSDGTLLSNAKVLPARVVNLGFEIDGRVAEVKVVAGEKVTAGQILGGLDIRDLNLDVERARAELSQSRAGYEQLTADVAPEQIAQAQAKVDEARARLNLQNVTVSKEDLEAARAQLREAEALLAKLRNGPESEELASRQAVVDSARARLQTRRDTLAAEKLRVELQVERASNDVRDAQAAYSRIYWRNRGLGDALKQEDLDAEDVALRAVQNAEKARDELLLVLEEARKKEVTDPAAYEADLRQAQAQVDKLLVPPKPEEIAAAEKAVASAKANLEQLQGAVPQESREIYAASLRNAEATLAELQADPQASELAIAEAQITLAEADLKQAELAIERAYVRSPINGTVVSVNIEPGQVVQGSNEVFTIADLTQWRLITADLSELNIAQIRQGDQVQINFFALPELRLTGKVSAIETIGRESGVGTNYAVTIIPDSWDDRLRWNMSAQVAFTVGAQADSRP
ncbi:MAG: HlyD family efflux transporter periplasmic adaptor subunit [Chloroflexales bacterium]|nr:HlyD family efflux transporter periplasmic adaptor subunit [Chloroflexales bacterium]